MSPLPYNASAIEANKQGRLTSAQSSGLIPMILMGGVLFLMGCVFAAATVYSLFKQNFIASTVALLIFLGGLSVVLLWIGYLVAGRRLIDMITGKVRTIEGTGNRWLGGGGQVNPSRYYKVGEMDFQINAKMYDSLPDSTKKVRAYYTPLSKSLVNVEMLEDWLSRKVSGA